MNQNQDPLGKKRKIPNVPKEAIEMLESYIKNRRRKLFEDNKFTEWFRKLIIDENLLRYFERSMPEISDFLYEKDMREPLKYDCHEDEQYLEVDYIAPILIEDVNFEPWKESRMDKISKWGNYHILNRIYFNTDENNERRILNSLFLPILERTYDLESTINKFEVGDGNHRFAFAKENNIPTVMSIVHDKYIIKKSWVEKRLEKFRKERDKELNDPNRAVLRIT